MGGGKDEVGWMVWKGSFVRKGMDLGGESRISEMEGAGGRCSGNS